MNKKQLVHKFIDAVSKMRKTHVNGTYYWLLGEDDKGNNWAIVLGWADGFYEDPDDNNTVGTWRLCAKLAYQPNNSIMQCDYDIDWLMPYDEETGSVDNNEISIYPNTDLPDIIDWLLRCYVDYQN